jgi:hypothetical protein
VYHWHHAAACALTTTLEDSKIKDEEKGHGDQLRDQRGHGSRYWYWSPFAPWAQGVAGMCWVWSPGGPTSPMAPTGTGAGPSADPPYRPGGCRPGSRPRVFPAHRPLSQLQLSAGFGFGTWYNVQWGGGAHCWLLALRISRPQTGKGFLHMACPFPQPDQISCRFRPALRRQAPIRAADRSSGTPAVLPS